jgi:hypothetical protein
MTTKTKKIFLISLLSLIGLSLFGYLALKVNHGFKQLKKDFAENLPSTYVLSSEDSSIIANRYRSKIEVVEVNNSKVRGPVSTVRFNSTYSIIIYKIALTGNISLDTAFHTKLKKVDRSVGYSYRIIGNRFFRFQYKSGEVSPPSKIYLTISDAPLNSLYSNDSLVYYHLSCENLSIRYSEKEPVDIFVEGNEGILGTYSIPMDLLFLKRNNGIYILLMTPLSRKAGIPSDLLYNIVFDK